MALAQNTEQEFRLNRELKVMEQEVGAFKHMLKINFNSKFRPARRVPTRWLTL